MEINKNVLYVGGFELPDKNAAAQRVIANGKLFSKLGYKVTFIGVDKDHYFYKPLMKKETIDGFNYNSKPQKYPATKKDWLTFITSISFVKDTIKNDLEGNVDIIIAYNYPSVSLMRLINYCKKHNIKLIVDVTEWYEPNGNLFFKIIKGIDTYIRMNILHRKADGVLAISKYLNDFYKDTNTLLLPPLVDKNSAKWSKVDCKPKDFSDLIYVGSPGNGFKDRIDVIILSLSKIKNSVRDFKFTIVGLTKSEYFTIFGRHSIPENVIDNVFFEGKKSHKDSIEKIKRADFSIFLRDNSLTNTAGFPTKFVESITCGTPVLTNPSSNISQFLKDGKIGYLINNIDNDNIDISLINAINLGKKELIEMKRECYSFKEFHFDFYEKEFAVFVSNLFKKDD